jgi:hypothetical protein
VRKDVWYILAAAVLATAAILLASRHMIRKMSDSADCGSLEVAWSHVYKPRRLKVLDACTSVTGTIVDDTGGRTHDGMRHERDGDSHGWLKLDPGQDKFLSEGNMSEQGGNLVFEIPCLYKVTQADAISSCEGYHSTVSVFPVGTHVSITGSWVQDDNHKHWTEIHPVISIQKR